MADQFDEHLAKLAECGWDEDLLSVFRTLRKENSALQERLSQSVVLVERQRLSARAGLAFVGFLVGVVFWAVFHSPAGRFQLQQFEERTARGQNVSYHYSAYRIDTQSGEVSKLEAGRWTSVGK